MALIKCPECKKKISDKAEFCPHCGLPKAYFYDVQNIQENFKIENRDAPNVPEDSKIENQDGPNVPEDSKDGPNAQKESKAENTDALTERVGQEGLRFDTTQEQGFESSNSSNTGESVLESHRLNSKETWELESPNLGKEEPGLESPNLGELGSKSPNLSKEKEIEIESPDLGKEEEIELEYSNLGNVFISFEKDYAELFGADSYISTAQAKQISKIYKIYFDDLENDLIFQYIKNNSAKFKVDYTAIFDFTQKFRNIQRDIQLHNSNYVERKLVELKDYFDTILKDIDPDIRLDEEQRRAVITDDNYCLLVAGAGAGKTTTMAAKVKYLVEKQGVKPEEIIVISYTNKAINELKERINSGLKIPAKICTFHTFAFEIVKRFAQVPPEINFSAYNIIFEMLEKNIYQDKKLMHNLVLFMGYYFDLTEDVFNFENLEQYHIYKSSQVYETIKSSLGEYIDKVADQRSRQVKTITGEYLRSVQEVQIANFLYLNGIDYVYEKVYPYGTLSGRKKYTPDFYIHQGDLEAYIEHYGITESYYSNLYTPQQLAVYKKHILHKRMLHKQCTTTLIETWSVYKDKRSIFDHLAEELKKKGFVLKPRSFEEVYKKIVDTGKDKYIYKFIFFMINFIEQYKTIGFDEEGFGILRKKTDNVRNLLFLEIAEKVYHHYQNTLKERNQIDFADMINDGHDYLLEIQKQQMELPYKYVIIDEFQDIARQRFNLTKRLSEITKAKVVAVGDDWQSIYAFAGSDITLFTKFLDLMGEGKELKITHTYRNSQELIDIAGGFIQKNSKQIHKKLISPKNLENPIILEPYDASFKLTLNLAEAVINMIDKIITEYGEDSSILLLGRYGFDMHKLYNTGKFVELQGNKVRCNKYPKAKITFMTAHSAKGLGFDNVVILNMLEGKFGFPCQIEEDPIMKMVTHEDLSIPYAEERRLFYVALTRTKNRVYICTPLDKPSRFLVELINEYHIAAPKDMNMEMVEIFKIRCPICGFPLKYEFNKNYGLGLYICTNEMEICDFMTNDKQALKDIFKCSECKDGFMIVKKRIGAQHKFYACTNYDNKDIRCKNVMPF